MNPLLHHNLALAPNLAKRMMRLVLETGNDSQRPVRFFDRLCGMGNRNIVVSLVDDAFRRKRTHDLKWSIHTVVNR